MDNNTPEAFEISKNAVSRGGKLGKFLKGYYKIKSAFQNTNGNKYSKYAKQYLDLLFEADPNAKINDITKDNIHESTTHHIEPQREIKGTEKMSDLDNLAPASRELHNQADNGEVNLESIGTSKKKFSIRLILISLFDALLSSFIFGFFSELFYVLFSSLFFKKDGFSTKNAFINSIKAGLRLLLVSLPITLIIFPIAAIFGNDSNVCTIVQFSILFVIFGFTLYMSLCNHVDNGKSKREIFTLILSFLVTTGIGISCELILEKLFPTSFLDDLLTSFIMAILMAFERILFDVINRKKSK